MSGSPNKQSGLGDHFAFGGYLIGGDIQQLSLSTPLGVLDVTDITQSAHSRIGGLRDGSLELTAFWDNAAGQEHAAFSPLTLNDVIATYLRGQALGNAIACLNCKQLSYDPTRAADGMLTEKVSASANGYGLEWGIQLTPGVRTDTADTNGSSVNLGAAGNYGAQAYLQAIGLTGTSGTVTIQHAPDNATWSTLLAFAAAAAVPSAQRIATVSGAFTATHASPAVFTWPAPLSNGQPVVLAGTSLPGGFTAGTEYWVVSASGSTSELAATSGGAAINSTSAGSGTMQQVVQQYVRAITAGTFSSFEFIAALVANQVAVTF